MALPRPEWERCENRLRYSTDPPKARIATIAWDSGEGQVTGVNVWDTPGAVADFYMERVQPTVEAEGEPTNKPQRHGEPLAFCFGAAAMASVERRILGQCGRVLGIVRVL
jgi:hypothetical protein